VVSVKLAVTPWAFFRCSPPGVGVRRVRCWGQGSGEARPRSGRQGLDADTVESAQHGRGGEHQIQLSIMIGSCSLGLCPGCVESVGRPCLSGCSDTGVRRQDGDRGVPAMGAAARSWSAVRQVLAATGLLGAGRGSSVIGRETLPDTPGSGSWCEHLIAQVPQRVVAAAGELAGDRQQR
jgi:hypothetical protein